MGCLRCQPIRAIREANREMVYSDTIVSSGIPTMVDFRSRNRRVVSVSANSPLMRYSFSQDQVFMDGPYGLEVIVRYAIGR